MSVNSMDPAVLKTALMGVVEPILSKMSSIGVSPSQDPQVNEIDIVEYDGRMRVAGLEKFNSVCFVSAVNFYLSQAEQKQNKVKGAMVLYMDSENGSKIYKVLGFPVPDDEDDISMMEACGKICKLIGEGFVNALTNSGYTSLVMSEPDNHKNNIMEGIAFSKEQKKLQEFCFFYWKKKTIAIELTLAAIPMKK